MYNVSYVRHCLCVATEKDGVCVSFHKSVLMSIIHTDPVFEWLEELGGGEKKRYFSGGAI